MIGRAFRKIFPDYSERVRRKLWSKVTEINTIYESYKNLTDRDLQSKTDEFKARLKDGETLDDIMCEAFAAVKETCRRLLGKQWSVRGIKITWDMVPFDVQLFGAIILHQGKVAEMATGEGKTLVATMPLYLNALTGKGAHLATVNDYLASRDREWMGPVYEFLGLTVGVIQNQMDSAQRKIQYACDITYGTANEFGFDYLRDNMCWDKNELVQRGHYYAIVDEADSILIDEARTPLIISGPVERSTHRYEELKRPVENLIRRQNELLNRIILDARRYLDVNDLLDEGKREEAESLLNELQQKNSQDGSYFTDDPWYNAGILLLQAKRGGPKHKRLTKILHEPGLQKLIQKVETDFIRDKRLPEIDEDLYFTIDEKTHVVDLTEKGRITLSSNDDPNYFVLHDLGEEFYKIDQDVTLSPQEKQEKKAKIEEAYAEKSEKLHNINQLLKAYSLFEKNVEYIKADGRIKIVDEFTGRILEGRRYSDGLHEAIEAKEGVTIQRETQTLATITLQNYFRLYDKLAGMTGTAYTEAHEFYDVYKLDVVVIPTHKPVRRDDYDDIIYKSKREKYNAIINEIEEMHKIGRPVLVGTISVDVSETLERMLRSRNIKASVLNAKRHQQEAEIVARAGMPGAVTISTNMAGRGTDIKLAPEVVKLGGLHIVGTERHESRRIDRQLRGRSGRQGDAGSSRFYLSLEDDLMRLFGSDRVAGIMDRLGIQEDEPIQHPMVTRSIERAQKRVEMHNFDIRKHLLEYDDVMDRQRKIIYDLRTQALLGENLKERIHEMIEEFIEKKIEDYTDENLSPEEWNWDGLKTDILRVMFIELPLKIDDIQVSDQKELFEFFKEKALQRYQLIENSLRDKGIEMRELESFWTRQVIDERWKDHLYEMDQLKEGIGLRAYGQKDPLIEYKSEAYRMFTELLDMINEQVLARILRPLIPHDTMLPRRGVPQQARTVHDSTVGMGFTVVPQESAKRSDETTVRREKKQPVVVGEKIGRNDPCPCGSGKKYKKCCGAL